MTLTIEQAVHKHRIRHDLSEEEFTRRQARLIGTVEAKTGLPGVYAVWLTWDHPDADLIRTREAELFPEMPEVLTTFEDSCVFLALVDTREDAESIAFAARMSWPSFVVGRENIAESPMKIAMLSDLVDSGQGLTLEDVSGYYEAKGVDLSQCINVETMFRVGDRAEISLDVSMAQLGYVAIFSALARRNVPGESGIFADMNTRSLRSLRAMHVSYEPIVGRADLRTPTPGPAKYDDRYRPVFIPGTLENIAAVDPLLPFLPVEVRVPAPRA